jgi:Tfp pilus assembly protein PilZ
MENSENSIDKVNLSARLLNLILELPVEQQLKLLKLLDSWQNEGARKHPRKQRVIPVELEVKDHFFMESIKDISKGGVFVETESSFSIGEEIKMSIQLPNRSKPLEVIGEIVRSNPRGIGVKFKRYKNSS